MGKWRGKDGVFYFLAMQYQSLKRGGGKIFNGNINLDISLVMQNWKISLMACSVLNMCELMKGALHCEFFHIYIICMCGLRNPLITLRWDAIMASRLLELWRCKKGKNGTQFVFCRCIIRFFSQLCKKTWDWLNWRLPNDSCKWEKTFFCGSHVNFLGKPWKCSWHFAVTAKKVDF